VDGLVVVLVGAAGIVGLVVSVLAAEPAAAPVLSLLLVLLQAGALWWRRRQPLVVLVVTLVALLVAQAIGDINAASFLGPTLRRTRWLSTPTAPARSPASRS
jgi:hypothetical protein